MLIILSLVLFPLVAAIITLLTKKQKVLSAIVLISSLVIMVLTIIFAVNFFKVPALFDLSNYSFLKFIVVFVEILIASYIIYTSIKNRSYLVTCFSILQIGIMLFFEFTTGHKIEVKIGLYIDKLSVLMVIIAGIIGSLICIYAIEYMKDFHKMHSEIKNRQNIFFSVLFLFLSAMFGLVISNDMTLMLLFWEITSLCSFLLIGYTQKKDAIKNSFTALTINVGGGLMFTIGIVLLGVMYGVLDFDSLLVLGFNTNVNLIPIFLIAIAGFTKSAQMPFSKWLLGAMVAPTPTSAMLHSSTMVKAGVYLIIRLAPMLGKNAAGITVTLIGGITFIFGAVLAVSQRDAKKILAYSTISNLGLIVACAGIDSAEALWAAIMLIVFHAIAKSLLFLTVGSVEHKIGSRDVEDMDGLFKISRVLTMLLIIGIAGMFLAPFGMLISKWAAIKAFVDSGNILILLLIAYGSTITMFFWAKWMGKLIANAQRVSTSEYEMGRNEKFPLYILAIMVVIICIAHPIVSSKIVIAYINSNMHINFVAPIDRTDTTIIILMMSILFILPIILIPLYKKYRVKDTSVYFSGENTGDNESFYGSMGEVKQLELKNLYLYDIFKPNIWGRVCMILCTLVIIVGFFASIGGMLA